ncbi:MAG: DUF166 family protein [Methanocellales archaeon]
MQVGVITRGKYGKRLIEVVKNKTPFKVSSIELPLSLPEFIDDPEKFLNELGIDGSIFKADLIISYALHADLNPEIVRRAALSGARAVIIGGTKDSLVYQELRRKYGITLEVSEVCCSLVDPENEVLKKWFEYFGMPEYEIKVKDGRISEVKVIRSTPCGGSYYVAENLLGAKVEEAPRRAALLVQYYPCRASRGWVDGKCGAIHLSGEFQMRAVERALKKLGLNVVSGLNVEG